MNTIIEDLESGKPVSWDVLDGEMWFEALSSQYSHKYVLGQCDIHNGWEKLEGCHWWLLLEHHPELLEKCCWKKLEAEDWGSLLQAVPEAASYCDQYDAWQKMDGGIIATVIHLQPQLINHCDFSKFSENDWTDFLSSLPQYSDRCAKWGEFQPVNWAALLRSQPQFADRCDKWDQIHPLDWAQLIRYQPQFADRCDKWAEFDGDCWQQVLIYQPQFWGRCKDWSWLEKFESYDWEYVVEKQLAFIPKCDQYNGWNKFTSYHWKIFLKKYPCFWARYEKFSSVKLSPEELAYIQEKTEPNAVE